MYQITHLGPVLDEPSCNLKETKKEDKTPVTESWFSAANTVRTIFPIPRLPPVTSTTFPLTPKRFSVSSDDADIVCCAGMRKRKGGERGLDAVLCSPRRSGYSRSGKSERLPRYPNHRSFTARLYTTYRNKFTCD